MQAHWTAFGVGLVVGGLLAFWMTSGKGGTMPAGAGITGGFAAPFQNKIQRG